jgi:hypothetical protein
VGAKLPARPGEAVELLDRQDRLAPEEAAEEAGRHERYAGDFSAREHGKTKLEVREARVVERDRERSGRGRHAATAACIWLTRRTACKGMRSCVSGIET